MPPVLVETLAMVLSDVVAVNYCKNAPEDRLLTEVCRADSAELIWPISLSSLL